MPRRPPIHQPMPAITGRHEVSDHKRFHHLYGYRWQKERKAFIAAHPLCCDCEERGILTPTEEVDHDVPHKGNLRLFWDKSNWKPRCKPCHSAKTAREDGGFGNARRPASERH